MPCTCALVIILSLLILILYLLVYGLYVFLLEEKVQFFSNLDTGLEASVSQQVPSVLSCHLLCIILSFIPAISIAPLQVLYYSEALPTTTRILYRSFTPKRTDNCR